MSVQVPPQSFSIAFRFFINSVRGRLCPAPHRFPSLLRKCLPASRVCKPSDESVLWIPRPVDIYRESPPPPEELSSNDDRWSPRIHNPCLGPPSQKFSARRAFPASRTSCWLCALLPDCSK